MSDLRQRALGALLKNAVFSPLSALVIAAGIALVGLDVDIPVLGVALNLSPWWWLVALLPLWIIVVGLQVLSRSAGEAAVSQALRETFDIGVITNPHLQQNVAQAIAYRQRIDAAVDRFRDNIMHDRMKDAADQVEEWVRRIYTLSVRLDTFRNDGVIANDLRSVPESIRSLQQRMLAAGNESLRREIQDTIDRRKTQLTALENLSQTMSRAELQLENTLTALGTVYSQMLLVDAKEVDSSKTQRLRENILDQVNSLNDVLSSMDEVYESKGMGDRG
jgi:predicted RNA-binding Zn ribbon-like protein